MTKRQRLELEQSEKRERVNALLEQETRTEAEQTELVTLTQRLQAIEPELRAAIVSDSTGDPVTVETRDTTGEGAELRQIAQRASVGAYIQAAYERRSVEGPERELNEALGVGLNRVPAALFYGDDRLEVEVRRTTDASNTVMPRSWLDRVFAGSCAEHLGIRTESVGAGEASFPVLATGGTPAQRGREEAAADATWTVAADNLSPTRIALHYQFASEDALRLPGLDEALRRDMMGAIRERVDYTIFNGDSGANEAGADIAGILGLTGVTEKTLTQANKLLADKTISEFADLIDGVYASSLADLRVCAFQGANALWLSTIHSTSTTNETIAQFLMKSGLSWMTRGGIAADTNDGSYGAAIGRQRGMDGAGVIAVWEGVDLITDPYSQAASGKVLLTAQQYWAYKVVRAANFATLKFVG